MGLRIFHTADWHLGHSLHGVSREYEHRQFLAWLLDILEGRQANVLLIAGDLFDSANPPASAQAMFYRFVVEAQRRLPRLQIVAIAGNHDSAERLEAPSPILDALNVRVVGRPRRLSDGRLDTGRLLVPLLGGTGGTAAWCVAVPFLRPSDLHADTDNGEDPLVTGVTRLYGDVIAAVEQVRRHNQALIAMGHCYMVGAGLSELSERKILGGNQHALPATLFPKQITYAALGHLHLAQTVGGQAHIRYSGSPIPLALDERDYPHQVVQIDLEGARLLASDSIPVPRFVDILRFPACSSAAVEAVEVMLAAYPFGEDLPAERYPFLEVVARLERPEPGLRQRIETALDGRPARLLKLATEYAGAPTGMEPVMPAQRLDELEPDGVFRERYRQQFENEPPPPLMDAFHELLEDVEGEET